MQREAALALTLLLVPLASLVDADGPTVSPYSTPLPMGGSATGYIGLPADPAAATHLVVILKGVDHTASDWIPVLNEIAVRGQIGVALQYDDFDADYAAQSAVATALDLYAAHDGLATGVLLGVSGGMPGGTLALAAMPHKPAAAGRSGPLFDYVLDLEGVANLAETYAEATGAGLVVEAANPARLEIEAECGAPAEPSCLAARSGVVRSVDFAARGLKGAWIIQAVNDGLVPYNQGLEFAASLRAAGIPVDHTTVLRGDYSDEKDTGLTEHATGAAGAPDVPLMGHASEDSRTHPLVNITLNTLWAIFGGYVPGTNGASVFDGELGGLP